jgi:hypothetical protein
MHSEMFSKIYLILLIWRKHTVSFYIFSNGARYTFSGEANSFTHITIQNKKPSFNFRGTSVQLDLGPTSKMLLICSSFIKLIVSKHLDSPQNELQFENVGEFDFTFENNLDRNRWTWWVGTFDEKHEIKMLYTCNLLQKHYSQKSQFS